MVLQACCRLAVALASGATQCLVISSLVPWGIARTSTVLTRFHQEFFARMPTPDEVRLLQLPSGTPVMDVLRVAYGEDGPLEVYTAVVNAATIIFTEDFDAPE